MALAIFLPQDTHLGRFLLNLISFTDGLKPVKRKKDNTEKLMEVMSDGGHSSDNADSERKKKKARTTFTGRQIFELEKQFEHKKYLSSSERSEMAKLLQVTETQVSPVNYYEKKNNNKPLHFLRPINIPYFNVNAGWQAR